MPIAGRWSRKTGIPGRSLAALIALQSFIAATANPDNETGDVYQNIKLVLEQHIATARKRVMEDNLARLLDALGEQNLGDIQSVHAALSRNGFHQTVLAAIQHCRTRHCSPPPPG